MTNLDARRFAFEWVAERYFPAEPLEELLKRAETLFNWLVGPWPVETLAGELEGEFDPLSVEVGTHGGVAEALSLHDAELGHDGEQNGLTAITVGDLGNHDIDSVAGLDSRSVGGAGRVGNDPAPMPGDAP